MKRIYNLMLIFLFIVIQARAGDLKLNFSNANLTSVIEFVSKATGKNFIYTPSIKGKISAITPSGISKEELFNFFSAILKLEGYTLVKVDDKTYKVVQERHARSSGLNSSETELSKTENYIVRLFKLKHISASEAYRVLKSLISRYGYISASGPKQLLIMDSGAKLKNIELLLKKIDISPQRKESIVVSLDYLSPEDTVKLLKEGKLIPKNVSVVAVPKIKGVLLVGNKKDILFLKSLIKKIDIPPKKEERVMNVYFLKNTEAEIVAKELQDFVRVYDKEKVSISPDKNSNSLLISATPKVYRKLIKIIEKLDRKKKQVFVEAMIVEVSIDKLKNLTNHWRGVIRNNGDPVLVGGFGSMSNVVEQLIYGMNGLSAGGATDFVKITYPNFNPTNGSTSEATITIPQLSYIFNSEAFKGVVNILSTPRILTTDNQEAEIVVGENVPFISKRESSAARSQSVFTSIERKDVGITLKITPHITSDDYIRLDLYQEISSLKRQSDQIILALGPTTTKRTTKTTVVLKNRETIVIGGLMQEREEVSENKVPLLGDLPVINKLFKEKNTNRQKINLLVFITPYVVSSDKDIEKLTMKEKDNFYQLNKKYVKKVLIIYFNKFFSKEKIKSILKRYSLRVVKVKYKERKFYVIPDSFEVKEKLQQLPEIKKVEIGYKFVNEVH